MRILHTADWHLGIGLEQRSRREEQEQFIDELIKIADEQCIDLILLAGDVYDTYNPPAWAERLFYQAVKGLAKPGERAMAIIAGNHDSPERLAAPSNLLADAGAFLVPLPTTELSSGHFGGFDIISHGTGCFEIIINKEAAVIAAMPFASERRLNELVSISAEEKDLQRSFSQRIGELFAEQAANFREDTINLVMGHFHISGGDPSNGAERDIQLGGSFAINTCELPSNAQYIAMGHLHRAQHITADAPVYYSGSPLQYSLSEANQAKSVYIIDVNASGQAHIEKAFLPCPKPIALWKCASIAEALERCEQEQDNSWVYLLINDTRPLTRSETSELHALHPDIVSINLISAEDAANAELLGGLAQNSFQYKTLLEEFEDFYFYEKKTAVPAEALALFKEIVAQDNED